MIYIYILKLQHAKWYVGRTENPQFRLENHFGGGASSWTTRYPPVSIQKLIPGCDIFDEDKYVIKYMSQYGISNVRGGSFSAIDLTTAQIQIIEHMIKGANDKCFSCGLSGHFARDCPSTTANSGVESNSASDWESGSDWESIDSNEEVVYVCEFCDKEFADEKQCARHELKCTSRKQTKTEKQNSRPRTGACYRCGRTSHYSPDCYASRHIDGYKLD